MTLEMNSLPFDLDGSGQSPFRRDVVDCVHDILSFQVLAYFEIPPDQILRQLGFFIMQWPLPHLTLLPSHL